MRQTDASLFKDFWLCKNSWSRDWGENYDDSSDTLTIMEYILGEDGFFKIRRGVNRCGIESSFLIIPDFESWRDFEVCNDSEKSWVLKQLIDSKRALARKNIHKRFHRNEWMMSTLKAHI